MEEEGETVPIAINFVPDDISVRYVFLSNSRRYIRLNNALKESKNRNIQVIATSNVTKTAEQFSFVLNNEALLDEKAEFMDNSCYAAESIGGNEGGVHCLRRAGRIFPPGRQLCQCGHGVLVCQKKSVFAESIC